MEKAQQVARKKYNLHPGTEVSFGTVFDKEKDVTALEKFNLALELPWANKRS